jgi:CheY-like chemotaxis protein
VVDDEPLVRLFASKKLEQQGFRVHAASNADEALVLLETYPDVLTVLTDVDMPGMSGLDLADRLHEHYPEIGIVIMSARFPVDQMPCYGSFLPKAKLAANLVPYVQQAVIQAERRAARSPLV